MKLERILSKAEEMGLLPVESQHAGVNYVIDPESRRVLIMAPRGKERHAVILPIAAVKELAEAAGVLV